MVPCLGILLCPATVYETTADLAVALVKAEAFRCDSELFSVECGPDTFGFMHYYEIL